MKRRSRLPSSAGKPGRSAGAGELRERSAAQARALRRSEERLRALTQLSSDWFWEQDEHFRFTSVSAEGSGPRELPPSSFMLGKARWELEGTEMDDWDAHRAQLQRHEPFRDVELRRCGLDGRMRYAEVSGAPVFDPTGRFVGYRGVGRDVTERRRQEKLLRLQHQVARCLGATDDAREAIRCVLRCVCEAEAWDYGRCWLADEAAGVLQCFVSWQRPGSPVAQDAARSEDLVYQRGSGMVGRVWQSGEPLWVPDLHQAGGVQKVLTPGVALHGACIFPLGGGGRTLGAISFLTEAVRSADPQLLDTLQAIGSQLAQFLQRKQREDEIALLNAQLEARVRERTAQLQEANAELEAFAYSIAHDLRSPLTSIDGFSHLLGACSGPPGPRERHALARIRAGVRHMNALTEAMLTLARPSRSDIRREPVDLARLARETFAGLHESEPGRQAQLQAPEHLWADGDPLLLGRVVANLVGNAWKFSRRKERTRIRLGADTRDGETVFWVADEGAGFDMAYAGRLFGAFQRLHAADEFEGTGVGLAMVQKIVTRHGGRIWASAAPDQGATLLFTLARRAPQPPAG